MKKGRIELNANIIDFKKRFDNAIISPDPSQPSENWLWKLKEGTQFLCRPRQGDISDDLDLYLVAKRFFKESGRYSVLLVSELNQPLHVWKNPIRFVNQFDLVGILDEPSDNLQQEGLERTEQSERLD